MGFSTGKTPLGILPFIVVFLHIVGPAKSSSSMGISSVPSKNVISGSNVLIPCSVNGDSLSRITWLKDNRPMTYTLNRVILLKNGTLNIRNVQKHTDSGTYTCRISDDAGEFIGGTTLVVLVPPKIAPFQFPAKNLLEGARARMPCSVDEGDPPFTITWKKNDQRVDPQSGVTIQSIDELSSMLIIDPVKRSHEGNYTCSVTNAVATVSHTAQLLVNVPPLWVLKPKHATAVQDSRFTFDCRASGSPNPTINWMKTNDEYMTSGAQPVVSNNRMRILPNGSLTFDKALQGDSGYYVCAASNGIGAGLNAVVRLQIQTPPEFMRTQQTVIKVRLGERLNVKCASKGGLPLKVRWQKDGETIGLYSNRYVIQDEQVGPPEEGSSSEVIVTAATRDENGTWICLAENAYGKSEMKIDVVVLESPESPTIDTSVAVERKSVDLSWKRPFDGNSELTKYIIQYWPAHNTSQKSVHAVAGHLLSFRIAGLEPSTRYLLRVHAENSEGQSLPSNIVSVTTRQEEPKEVATDVQAVPINSHTVKVSWKVPDREIGTRNVDHVDGYYVGYRIEGSTEDYLYESVPASFTGYHDQFWAEISGLEAFTRYEIIVEAYNKEGKGPRTLPLYVVTKEGVPSDGPNDVKCRPISSDKLRISWSVPSTKIVNGVLQGYQVIYSASTDTSGGKENIAFTSVPEVLLDNLLKFTLYNVNVQIVSQGGVGPRSQIVMCRTLADVPDPPADIKVMSTSENAFLIIWKKPYNSNGIVTNYTVYVQDSSLRSPVAVVVNADTTSHEIGGLKSSEEYRVWVTAATNVGAGEKSRIVVQKSLSSQIPARVTSFDKKLDIVWDSNIVMDCPIVGTAPLSRKWTVRGDTLETGSSKIRQISNGSLAINSLSPADAGEYTCYVSNSFGQDRISYHLNILLPPPAPNVIVGTTTGNSIEISWTFNEIIGAAILGYTVKLRREYGVWTDIAVPVGTATYKISNLDCGGRYEIAIQAYNKVGQGPLSNPIRARTTGDVPVAPKSFQLIREEGMTSAVLDLSSWKSNGCPILYFTIEYAMFKSNDWVVAAEEINPAHGRYLLRNLMPSNWYNLRVMAHSSAGSVVSQYRFSTRTETGEILPPLTTPEKADKNPTTGTSVDLTLILIVLAAALAIVLIGVVVYLCVRHKYKVKGAVRGNADPRVVEASDMRHSTSVESFAYLRRPAAVTHDTGTVRSEPPDDPTPYATFQLIPQEPPPLPSSPPESRPFHGTQWKSHGPTYPTHARIHHAPPSPKVPLTYDIHGTPIKRGMHPISPTILSNHRKGPDAVTTFIFPRSHEV